MLRKYVISVPNQYVGEVERYLLENTLITGIMVDPVLDSSSGIVSITVMVRNKKNFLRWANPRKKFTEATDPVVFLVGKPQEVETMPRKERKELNEIKRKLRH
ncbi:MAG TPA: hypothetical protein PL121_02295 [bacterium]|nr:hypothetical protein [bacterium]